MVLSLPIYLYGHSHQQNKICKYTYVHIGDDKFVILPYLNVYPKSTKINYWHLQVCGHQYTIQIITSNLFMNFSQPEPSEKQEVLVPNTLDDDGFQVVLNKKRIRDMWREYEKKLHMKLISIGKSLAEDDMMDSDTTGK